MAQSGHLSKSKLPLTAVLIALVGGVSFGGFALKPLLKLAADAPPIPSLLGSNPGEVLLEDKDASGQRTADAPPSGLSLLSSVPSEVLLLGTDGSGQRTDVMASLNLSDSGVHLTQIPRDTFVRSASHGEHKANAIYLFGGINAVESKVSAMLGRPVSHHVIVNLGALRRIGDALGGLEIDVAKPLRYNDYTQGLHIDIPAGRQRLNGNQLEGFLRFRHDAEGDLGRMRRQRQALQALKRKLTSPAGIARLPQLLHAASGSIETNLNLIQLTGLAHMLVSQPLSGSRMPGHLGYRNGISYWFIGNPDRRL